MKRVLALVITLAMVFAVIPFSGISATAEEGQGGFLFAIDAGHGGGDSGAIGCDGRYEANDNIKVAEEVIRILNVYGQRTVLIDRNLQTKDRPKQANAYNADFLISIHRDSSPGSSAARGISIYTHEPSHYERAYYGDQKEYAPAERADKHTIDDALIQNLSDELTNASDLSLKGVYYGSASAPTWEDYFINRISNMPSCIIEMGFVSNPQDNAIFDRSWRDIAAAIARGILRTVGIHTKITLEYHPSDDTWYAVEDGRICWGYTGLVLYNNCWYYVQKGKLNWNSEPTLTYYGGEWYYTANGILDCNYNGLVFYNESWYFVKNGMVDGNYTGLVSHDGGLYFVQDGMINWEYTGIAEYNGNIYYVQKGFLYWGVNDTVFTNGNWYKFVDSTLKNLTYHEDDGTWYYETDGVVDTTYTGFANANNQGGCYYVTDGKLTFGKKGLYEVGGKTYYLNNSYIDIFETLVQKDGVWYYVKNGLTDTKFTGLVNYEENLCYVQNGIFSGGVNDVKVINGAYYKLVDSKVKNLTYHQDDGIWYYETDGVVDTTYTGFANSGNIGGCYLVENGKVIFGKTGLYNIDGVWYNINNSYIDMSETLILHTDNNWYYVNGGVIDWNYTGLVNYYDTLYYVQKGFLYWGVNETKVINGAYYKLINSTVRNLTYHPGDNTWYFEENGKANTSYTGFANSGNIGGCYYVVNGKLTFGMYGLYLVDDVWYFINNSYIDMSETLILHTDNNWYYVNGGVIDWNYTGFVEYNGWNYYITNGWLDWSKQPK